MKRKSYKYQIFGCLGFMFIGMVLDSSELNDLGNLMFVLGNSNLFLIIPREENFLHEKFGNNFKGFAVYNLIIGTSYVFSILSVRSISAWSGNFLSLFFESLLSVLVFVTIVVFAFKKFRKNNSVV